MAIGNMSKKSGEDRTCSSEDTIADRQTHRQTDRHGHHNTPLNHHHSAHMQVARCIVCALCVLCKNG